MKRLTFEEVKNHINSKEAELLSNEYVNSLTELTIRCSCGNIFKRKFKIIQRSKICKCEQCTSDYLNKERFVPYSDIIKKIKERGYEILVTEDDYEGINKKYTFICPQGHERNMWLSDLLKGHECKICATEKVVSKMRFLYDDVKEYIESHNNKLLSTEYKNCEDKLSIQCEKGHQFEMSYHNFKNGNRCPVCKGIECSKRQTIPFNKVKEAIESYGYKVLTEENQYVNGNSKIVIECTKNHKFNMCFHDFKQGYRCPMCNESKGEKNVKCIFKKYNINYIEQYRFKDCKCKRSLPFDFYLPKYNCCIEYDGKQHYLYGSFNCDLLDLMNIKYRDNIKDLYCKENNIKLIRIPYWDFDNIETILIKELNL